MTSWLFTALFVLLMTGATVLMLAILVGLCRDRSKGTGRYDTSLARLHPFCPAQVRGRTRGLNS